MRKSSLADAKTHLSKLVDEAEHHGKSIMILRHGKPAAVLVPVPAVAQPRTLEKKRSDRQVKRSVQAFIDEFSAMEADVSAVEDLIAGRR